MVLDATVTLPDGTRVAGTVPGVHGDRLVRVVYSKLGRQAPAAGLGAAAAASSPRTRAATGARPPWAVRGDAARPCRCWSPPSPARRGRPARRARRGLPGRASESPLPLAPKTSGAYAEKRRGGSPVAASTLKAEGEWRRNYQGREIGEFDDPEHLRVWGDRPLDALLVAPARADLAWAEEGTLFGQLARIVWEPLLVARADRDGMSDVFDLTGELPTGTTVLEASAGTGKTHTIAALAARYVAEGVARIDELMLVTFGRAATVELRERVRERLVGAGSRAGRPRDRPRVGRRGRVAISRPGRPTWSTYDGSGWRTPSRTSTRPPSPPPTASATRCSRGSGSPPTSTAT